MKKIVPDLEVPVSEHKNFRFFYKKTVEKYVREFGWALITKDNIRDIFLQNLQYVGLNGGMKNENIYS